MASSPGVSGKSGAGCPGFEYRSPPLIRGQVDRRGLRAPGFR